VTGKPILYTRANCPLCDELKDTLRRFSVPFTERDIATNADWYARYRERIPVVVDPSGHEFDPPFDDALVVSWGGFGVDSRRDGA
jgi:hypothetical protein